MNIKEKLMSYELTKEERDSLIVSKNHNKYTMVQTRLFVNFLIV